MYHNNDSGYGQLNPFGFGLWLNIDKAINNSDHLNFLSLTWNSFHFPNGDQHREYLNNLGEDDKELALNCFSSYAHEARHFHDLLLSSYGSMLMRQYTRIALFYLFSWHELLFQTKAIYVPIGDWIRDLPLYNEIPPPSRNIVELNSTIQTVKEKTKLFNNGTLRLEGYLKNLNADAILEGLAIITQERSIARDFGTDNAYFFRKKMQAQPSAHKYYGALSFLDEMIHCKDSLEISSYILFASLCGDFQNPNEKILRYPKDILVQICVRLKERGFNGTNVSSSKDMTNLVDEYFDQNFGCDLAGVFDLTSKSNDQFYDSMLESIVNFETLTGRKSEPGRTLLNVFKNFCEVRRSLGKAVLADPVSYHSEEYILNQRNLPQPLIFIETSNGVPLSRDFDKLFYPYISTSMLLQDFPSDMQKKYGHLADENGKIRAGYILVPQFNKQNTEDQETIEVDLWLKNYSNIAGLQLLYSGIDGISAYIAKDIISGFSLTGTQIYSLRNRNGITEVMPLDKSDPRMVHIFDQKFEKELELLSQQKIKN